MTFSKKIENIIKTLALSSLIVALVQFFYSIPAIVLFAFIFLIILVNLYKNLSGLFIFSALATATMTILPNILLSLFTYFFDDKYVYFISTVSLVALISFIGGKCFNFYVPKKGWYLSSLLAICLIAAFIFKEPMVYEKGLSIIYFFIISIITIYFGGQVSKNYFNPNIKQSHNIIFLLILILAFFLPNYIIKRPLQKLALIECFNQWASTEGDYSTENMSLEGGYSYSLLKKTLEQKYTVFSVNDRARLKDTLNGVDAAIMITPTVPLNYQEENDLVGFVGNGGRLVVIADHTDLYGHARVLNTLLKKTGIRVKYNSLFYHNDYYAKVNLSNMPMYSVRPKTPCSFSAGKFGYIFAWANNWISEAADYVRPNFFGELKWTSDDLVGNWPVGVIKNYGRGFVVVWGDSTIFANFCIFQPDIIKFLGILLEGGEVLAFFVPYCLLLLAFTILYFLFSSSSKNNIITFCSLGLVLLSGSYYRWDSDPDKFYQINKRVDIYGVKTLFDEPPPNKLPKEGQFSTAFSHIARCGLWPLYKGEKPKNPTLVKSIWVTSLDQVKNTDDRILNSLWGIVINNGDDKMEIGFSKGYMNDDLSNIFKIYFNQHTSQRQALLTKEGKHTVLYRGVSLFAADGVMTDRYFGDWWITTDISPYRKFMLKEWFDWLNKKDEISMFVYPQIGVTESNKSWLIKFGTKELEEIEMSVQRYGADKNFVYIGSGIWALYEKNKDGEFLLGGSETSDDTFKSGNVRWAAQALQKIKGKR